MNIRRNVIIIFFLCFVVASMANAQGALSKLAKCSVPDDYSKDFFIKDRIVHVDATKTDTTKYFGSEDDLLGYAISPASCIVIYFDAKNKILGSTIRKGDTIIRLDKDNKQVGKLVISSVTLKEYNSKGKYIGDKTITTTSSDK